MNYVKETLITSVIFVALIIALFIGHIVAGGVYDWFVVAMFLTMLVAVVFVATFVGGIIKECGQNTKSFALSIANSILLACVAFCIVGSGFYVMKALEYLL